MLEGLPSYNTGGALACDEAGRGQRADDHSKKKKTMQEGEDNVANDMDEEMEQTTMEPTGTGGTGEPRVAGGARQEK